jgi:hypothetical protein
LKAKNQELLQMNGNLSSQILQMQTKQQQLEEDIRTLKKYKKLVNNSMALQCKHCAYTLMKENFQEHIQGCMKEQDRNRASILVPHSATNSPFGQAPGQQPPSIPPRYSTGVLMSSKGREGQYQNLFDQGKYQQHPTTSNGNGNQSLSQSVIPQVVPNSIGPQKS